MVMLRTGFLVICENYMLRNGNLGLKVEVSRAAHTQYADIWKYPPPPSPGCLCEAVADPEGAQQASPKI